MQLPPEIRGVLQDAVSRARSEGLPLCPRMDLSLEDFARKTPIATRMIRSDIGVDCVPYAALPALAGDHANNARELRTVLTTPKGIEIVVGRRLRMGQVPGGLRAPAQRLARAHVVRARPRRGALLHRPRATSSARRRRAPTSSTADGPSTRPCGAWPPPATSRTRSPSSSLHHLRSLQLARPRERGRGHPRARVRDALPPGRVRRRAPRHDRGHLATRQRLRASPSRLLQRQGPRRRARHERRAVPCAGRRLPRALGPDALLGHERRRLSRHLARRLGSHPRGARRDQGGVRVRARPRSRPGRRRGRSVRRARAARPGAARRARPVVDRRRDRRGASSARARRAR